MKKCYLVEIVPFRVALKDWCSSCIACRPDSKTLAMMEMKELVLGNSIVLFPWSSDPVNLTNLCTA
jgi:hypothetical protein